MSAKENKAFLRAYFKAFEEAMRTGNSERLENFLAPNFLLHSPGSTTAIQPLETIRQKISAFRAAFPDTQYIIEDMIAEGDKVAFRVTWRATHKGAFMGIPPTDKKVTVTDIHFERIEQGKIVERWLESDTLGLLQQLGVVLSPS